MESLVTRIVALGAALVITAAVIVFAEFGGLYITNKAEIAGRPKPQEYIINLQPPPAHKVP
jgi:hypothetical protein